MGGFLLKCYSHKVITGIWKLPISISYMQEPPDMKTINEQREMIMRFADRDKDDRIRREELGLFFSESRRVQETKMDAKGREASKDS